jgi:hypothetical protein
MKYIPLILVAVLANVNLHAKGDLGRSSVVAEVGFGKAKIKKTSFSESSFSIGLSGTHALVRDPDLFGADLGLGYKYTDYSIIDTHDFEFSATPYLHLSQYFKPYLLAGIGLTNLNGFGSSSTEFSYSVGIGIESEFIENWSTRISYDVRFVDDLDEGIFGLGTGYWFGNGFGLGIDYSHAVIDYWGGDLVRDSVGLNAGFAF